MHAEVGILRVYYDDFSSGFRRDEQFKHLFLLFGVVNLTLRQAQAECKCFLQHHAYLSLRSGFFRNKSHFFLSFQAPVVPRHEQRRGCKDRGVGSRRNPDEQCQDKRMDAFPAEQK